MAQNSVSMLLKLILAGVVLTLIVALANYLNVSRSITNVDADTEAQVLTSVNNGKAFAAISSPNVAPSICILPVKIGSALSKSQLISFFASEFTYIYGIPASGVSPYGALRYGSRSQRMACMITKMVFSFQEIKQPGFIQHMVDMQETGDHGVRTGCDVPDTLTGLPFTIVC